MATHDEIIKKVRVLMAYEGINDKELAERMGIAQPTLSLKFKSGKLSEKDLLRIAEACGAQAQVTYDVAFTRNDGTVI